MNEKIINNMIEFIEEKERELQAAKLTNDTKAKNDVVNSILTQLDKEVQDEN